MGGQAAKYAKKGMDYFTGDQSEDEPTSSSAVKIHSNFKGTPFVLTRTRFDIFMLQCTVHN